MLEKQILNDIATSAYMKNKKVAAQTQGQAKLKRSFLRMREQLGLISFAQGNSIKKYRD